MPARRRCQAQRKDGRPCRAWARRGSDLPRCAVHGRETSQTPLPVAVIEAEPSAAQRFYGRAYTLDEVRALVNLALDHSLNGELAAARVAVRRVMAQLEQDLAPAEYARLAGLIFTGTRTIAELMRAQRALSGAAADGISGAIARALDEMGAEWDLDL